MRDHPRPRPCLRTITALACIGAAWSGANGAAPRDELVIRPSRATRLAASVTARGSGAIAVDALGGRRAKSPTVFLRAHGRLFGIHDAQTQLARQRTHVDRLQHTHTTYHQVHRGIPVFSGVLKVHQDATGAVVAANGDVYPIPEKLELEPALDARQAAARAGAHMLAPAAATEHAELVIVDPGWYGDVPIGPHLAYHIVLTDRAAGVSEAFFVDAHSGAVLDRWNLLHTARVREIYHALNQPQVPGSLARVEGEPPTGDDDVDAAYDYSGDVYDYFDRAFGRDGIDDDGMTMMLTTHLGAEWFCPNAYWSGSRAVFCNGTVTDDVTAHELMHGMTQHTAGLIYQNQPGQLNEAFSDIFGEVIDQFNGDVAFAGAPGEPAWPAHPTGPGSDLPNNTRSQCSSAPGYADGFRWMLGEDAIAFGGAIRDMWDPTCEGHPDRANSPLQTCALSDNGGVHSGSGVLNHAFAMLVDGKAFNGYEIDAMGPILTAAVWYRALTVYLTSNSDFEDADWALNRAAADLVGTAPRDPRSGQPGDEFLPSHAANVAQALLAVEMNTPGRCGLQPDLLNAARPSECTKQIVLFEEHFEDGLENWTPSTTGNPATAYEWITTSGPLPFGHQGSAAFCDDLNDDCSAGDETAVHRLDSPTIDLPDELSFPVLAFDHFMDSEAGWDGGRIELQIDDGDWQAIPQTAFLYNPYNIRLISDAQDNSNPFADQAAFSGGGGPWGTTVVALSGLVRGGDAVRLRFALGKDVCSGGAGWYLDDVRVYDCPATADCDDDGIPDDVEATGDLENVVLHNVPDHANAFESDADFPPNDSWAQRFGLLLPKRIRRITLWGLYVDDDSPAADAFTVIFRAGGPLPGDAVYTRSRVPSVRRPSGFTVGGFTEYEITLHFDPVVELDAGDHWVEIHNDTDGDSDRFAWVSSRYSSQYPSAFAGEAPGTNWDPAPFHLSIAIVAEIEGADCNGDGIPDQCTVDPTFADQSPVLSPIGDGFPRTFEVTSPPPAVSDVEVRVLAAGDLGSTSETIEVRLNEEVIGELFEDGSDCPDALDEETILLSADAFNAAVGTGDALFELIASSTVNPDQCDDPSTLQIMLGYDRPDSDCDGNAVPDECELDVRFTASSLALSPIGSDESQRYTIHAPPVAASAVTLRVTAFTDLSGSSEHLELQLNGTLIGELFADDGNDCPDPPDEAVIELPAATYNDLLAGGDAVIDIVPSSAVNADTCDTPSVVTVAVEYDRPEPDCNDNTVLDVCELASGDAEDCDGDGVLDICQLTARFAVSSPQFTPVEHDVQHLFVIDPAPPAAQDVTLTLRGVADLDATNESVDVYVGEAFAGSAFAYNAGSCEASPHAHTLVVPAGVYNSALQDGRLVIRLQPSTAVTGGQCDGGDWLVIDVAYDRVQLDCDGNGRLDACDLAEGGVDCDLDARPDTCQLASEWTRTSPALTPLGGELTHFYRVRSAPDPAGDVALTLSARGDIGAASEQVVVRLEGIALGDLFGDSAEDCSVDPASETISIARDTFAAALADGEALFELMPTSNIDLSCDTADVRLTLSYAVSAPDCDEDGVLDSCAIADGSAADCNGNEAIDACELAGDPGLDCDDNAVLDACDLALDPELDCNRNDRLDPCDIADGDSRDDNDNGVPDECERVFPLLLVSDPPDGAVDARQPLDPKTGGPTGWNLITLTFDSSPAGLQAADFQVSSTGTPPAIEAVVLGERTVTLSLDVPIPAGECTTLNYIPGNQPVRLGYLPGDINGDRLSAPLDILALVDQLNGTLDPPLAVWQCDADRSGSCEPLDILRVVDLLNGASGFEPWSGRSLPECP